MANIPVKRKDWEALSDGDRQAIEDALRRAGSLGPGDAIEPVETPHLNLPAAVDPACVQECDGAYELAVEYCNSLPLPQARAICFAAAATVYGGCLALCWSVG